MQEHEISILNEISHLESLLEDVNKRTTNPSTLPLAGEEMLRSMKLSENPYLDDIVSNVHMYHDQQISKYEGGFFISGATIGIVKYKTYLIIKTKASLFELYEVFQFENICW